jgi:urea transport system ATP-binding protein
MLKVDGLNQYYGGSHILRGLSFEAKLGEVTVVLGRNGVGKTTLLKSLMGVVPVKAGSITLDGRTSPAPPATSACAAAWATCRRAARSSTA